MEILASYFDILLNYLVYLIEKLGYLGIFIAMFLESTFVPIPSEVIMIPAGIAVYKGSLNLYITIAVGVLGNLLGALFNYFLCAYFGRPILFKIGKYIFLKEQTIIKIEEYFKKHGEISTFVGRLIPGVRHYISLPAGIAKMNLKAFCFYTFSGSFIWVTILTYLGYAIGENRELIKQYLDIIILSCLVGCALLVIIYMAVMKVKNSRNENT
jgi:membrane protein DedA with SNARE-associated domain